MPRAVLSTRVRYLEPKLLDEYTAELPLRDYLYQDDPRGLPRLVERDYVRAEFHEWAAEVLATNGFDPAEIDLRYASVDVRLAPIREDGPPLSFPFMINSAFRYRGLNLHGPFVAGHQAGLSMVQTMTEVKYARFYLPAKFNNVFTSDFQTAVIAGSVHGISTDDQVDGLVAALPDRGRDPAAYLKSNIARLLTGGHITDAACGRSPFTYWPGNPLRGVPYKISPLAFGAGMPLYSNDFTYYSFLADEIHEVLLRDDRFLRLTDLIRRLGPMFKASLPQFSEGLLFDPDRNMAFITELIRRSSC